MAEEEKTGLIATNQQRELGKLLQYSIVFFQSTWCRTSNYGSLIHRSSRKREASPISDKTRRVLIIEIGEFCVRESGSSLLCLCGIHDGKEKCDDLEG
jgi:hypothetical protein